MESRLAATPLPPPLLPMPRMLTMLMRCRRAAAYAITAYATPPPYAAREIRSIHATMLMPPPPRCC